MGGLGWTVGGSGRGSQRERRRGSGAGSGQRPHQAPDPEQASDPEADGEDHHGAAARAAQQEEPTTKAARDYRRIFFASAFDEVPDRTGRVTVPQGLRSYAGLTKECVVIGANTHLEIWDAATWRAYEQEQEQAFAEQEEVALTS